MARVFALTQGLAPNHDHLHAIKRLLNLPDVEEIFISVAFVRNQGILKLETELRACSHISQVFVGIANGITSKQALEKLLDIGIFPYVVDMGTQSSIFHPKLYSAIGPESATVIMGSANLTSSGLSDNVEASSMVELDRTDHHDELYISSLLDPFRALIGQHPENVFQITTLQQVEDLKNQGRLEDESILKKAPILGVKANGASSVATPALPLHRRTQQIVPPPQLPVAPPANPPVAGVGNSVLGAVWSSKPLAERDLSIPTGANTNPTGSMNLKKGLMQGIDHRHYFKDVVFSPLTWSPDPSPGKNHLLRTQADFEIIINGISNGVYTLRITHNSLTNTTTYKQNNATTQVHWGTARPIISKKGLLGKHMTFYHLGGSNYQMEIT